MALDLDKIRWDDHDLEKITEMVSRRVTIDVETRSVHLGDIEMSLTTGEFLALRALAHSQGRPLTRDQLLHALHGDTDDAFDRSIDVVISRLRAKLGPEAGRLKTVRGVGYMLGL